MAFLCPQHREHICQNPQLSLRIWQGAVDHGRIAAQNRKWRQAYAFFGSAYEVAQLGLNGNHQAPNRSFHLDHLLTAGFNLVKACCELQQFEEAERYLLQQHNSILFTLLDEHCPMATRQQAAAWIDESLARVSELLSALDHTAQLKAVQLMTAQLRTRAAGTVYH